MLVHCQLVYSKDYQRLGGPVLIPGWISQTGLGPLIGRPNSHRPYSLGSARWVSGDSNFRFPFRSSMSLTWGFYHCLFGSIGQSDHLQVDISWSQLVSFRHSTVFSPFRDVLATAEDLSVGFGLLAG